MIPSKLTPATWLLLLATASAAPATETETTAPAAAADALADTPTDTGAAQPVPTNELGHSAFAPCSNADGEFKPFCLPKQHDIFYPGSTPYGKPNPIPPQSIPNPVHPSTNLKPPASNLGHDLLPRPQQHARQSRRLLHQHHRPVRRPRRQHPRRFRGRRGLQLRHHLRPLGLLPVAPGGGSPLPPFRRPSQHHAPPRRASRQRPGGAVALGPDGQPAVEAAGAQEEEARAHADARRRRRAVRGAAAGVWVRGAYDRRHVLLEQAAAEDWGRECDGAAGRWWFFLLAEGGGQ